MTPLRSGRGVAPGPASRLFAAALASTLGFSACAYTVVEDGRVNRRVASQIERGISKLRGLDFHEPVPMDVHSPDDLRGYLAKELEREYGAVELAHLSRVFTAIGLVDPGVDLSQALVRLYTAQVAGFYDPVARRLFLVDPMQPSEGGPLVGLLQFVLRRDLVGEMLLSHELTHALQHQNFSILSLADDPQDDDRALAARAAIEGDATIAGFAYTLGGMTDRALEDLVARLDAVPAEVAGVLPDTPEILREMLVFQYTAGASFVARAYLAAGWKGVDAVLEHPPRSTEQVLWPDKYYGRVDDPTAVSLGGLDGYAKDGWNEVLANTLGELPVRILVGRHLGEGRGVNVARGWDGDRFAAYARGADLHVFWMTIWDRENEAEEFRAAAEELYVKREPEGAPGALPWSVERRGEKVLVAIGVPDDATAQLSAGIWKETAFSTVLPEAAPPEA